MDRSEYAKIKISGIPSEFIEEYNLQTFAHNGWVYFEIFRGCYGLTQIGKLANNLMCTRLKKAGYFEAATNPGLLIHTCWPIKFFLIVHDFWFEYVGGEGMPTTCAKSSKNIMKSQKNGKEKKNQALTWNGIMPPSTMTEHAASISKDILKESFSDLTTRAQPNLIYRPTIIVKFTMDPKYKWPHQMWIFQALTLKA